MNRNLLLLSAFSLVLCVAAALGQSAPAAPSSPNIQLAAGASAQSNQPVSYASVTQLNGMLAQLEAASKNTQADLPKLRIDRWKTSAASKKETLAKIDSIQRNLQATLPDVISQLRTSPEDLPATFKLYRNLDALCDVVGSVAEDTGAFGSKDELQTMSNDLDGFDSTRKQMAQRMETLSASKEAEIVRLRTDLKTAQAAIPAAPPKKIVVDDTAPAKKPTTKKKPAAKPTTPGATTAKPGTGQTQTPATQTPPAQAPPKPQ
jgi:peptidoglycan hydrolase CwlO-like protein